MKPSAIDQIFKIVVALGILIVCLSVGYYFVMFLPQKENQKIEIQRIELEKKQQQDKQEQREKSEKSTSLTTCLLDSDVSYSKNWDAECKSQGLLSEKCISIIDMTPAEYAKEKGLPLEVETYTKFYEEKRNCSCRLPLNNSDRIEKWKNDSRDECYKRYGD